MDVQFLCGIAVLRAKCNSEAKRVVLWRKNSFEVIWAGITCTFRKGYDGLGWKCSFWAKRCFEVERCSSLVEGSFQIDAKVWEKLIFGWKIKRECRIETEVSLWTLNFEVHVEVWV